MTHRIGSEGDVTVVQVDDELVVGNREALKDGVLERLDDGARKILLDFQRTGYIDSSGLGVLVSLSKQIREEGGELTRLDTLFDITEDRGTALDDF